jgi:hypothetical protein
MKGDYAEEEISRKRAEEKTNRRGMKEKRK